MPQHIKFTFIVFILAGNFCFAQKKVNGTEHRYFNDLQTTGNPLIWMNLDTKKADSSRAGNYFSSTNSGKPYGLGFESTIPADLRKKNMYLFINGKLRISDTTQNIILVTNILRNDSTIIWKGVNVANKFGKAGEWVVIRDSLLIPSSFPPDSKLKIYIWNQDGKAEAGFDDLEIRLSHFRTPTYLVY